MRAFSVTSFFCTELTITATWAVNQRLSIKLSDSKLMNSGTITKFCVLRTTDICKAEWWQLSKLFRPLFNIYSTRSFSISSNWISIRATSMPRTWCFSPIEGTTGQFRCSPIVLSRQSDRQLDAISISLRLTASVSWNWSLDLFQRRQLAGNLRCFWRHVRRKRPVSSTSKTALIRGAIIAQTQMVCKQ